MEFEADRGKHGRSHRSCKANRNQENVQIVIEKQKQNLHNLLRKQANHHLKASLLQCNGLNVGCHRLVNLVRSLNVCMIKIIASNLVGHQVRL